MPSTEGYYMLSTKHRYTDGQTFSTAVIVTL